METGRSAQSANEFLRALAPQVIAQLQPPAELQKFTRNPALVGAYVESAVRSLVREYLAPIRVSTGTVIDVTQTSKEQLPQIDTIAWIPCPVPAVFVAGEFAVVPRSSSLGVLEIKSSMYLNSEQSLRLTNRLSPSSVKALTADSVPEEGLGAFVPGLAVVSTLLANQSLERLGALKGEGRLAVLFQQETEDGPISPQAEGIYCLLNFLAAIRRRARILDGMLAIPVGAVRRS